MWALVLLITVVMTAENNNIEKTEVILQKNITQEECLDRAIDIFVYSEGFDVLFSDNDIVVSYNIMCRTDLEWKK